MTTLYTVGHGARSAGDLLAVLQDAGVEVLADVRRYPGSRRHPQFGREALAGMLSDAGIDYEWWGGDLGGRRTAVEQAADRHRGWRVEAFRAYAAHMESTEFRQAMARLLELAASRRTSVLCSELLWWKCHRRLVADAALAAGAQVVHLGMGEPQIHELTPFARLEDGVLVYDGQEGSV